MQASWAPDPRWSEGWRPLRQRRWGLRPYSDHITSLDLFPAFRSIGGELTSGNDLHLPPMSVILATTGAQAVNGWDRDRRR